MRVERQPASHSVVRKGVRLAVTSWLAATMTPSSGSSVHGRSSKGT